MATHSSILAWRIPWAEEAGSLQSIGSQRDRHNWSDLALAGHGMLSDNSQDCGVFVLWTNYIYFQHKIKIESIMVRKCCVKSSKELRGGHKCCIKSWDQIAVFRVLQINSHSYPWWLNVPKDWKVPDIIARLKVLWLQFHKISRLRLSWNN